VGADYDLRRTGSRPAGPAYPCRRARTCCSWTGFYLGVNGGRGWTNSNNGNPTLALNDTVGGALFAPITIATSNHNAQSAVFGGQVGYNWQVQSWVIGVEGDLDGAKIVSSQQIVFPATTLLGSGGTGSLTEKQDWLASIRGRVGYTSGAGIIYITAGGAWTNVQLSAAATIAGAGGGDSGLFSVSTTRSGYVIGGGYEYMIDAHWIARAEYLYYGFTGAVSASNLITAVPAVVTANANNFNTSVARMCINYKFDGVLIKNYYCCPRFTLPKCVS
jgi:outer membrane immunogenic protein